MKEPLTEVLSGVQKAELKRAYEKSSKELDETRLRLEVRVHHQSNKFQLALMFYKIRQKRGEGVDL